MQRIIETLQGIYRSDDSYEDVETGDIVPITDYHPLVRTHPVTGWKSLFVNRRYTIGIKGMTQADSAPLLNRVSLSFLRLASLGVQLTRCTVAV